MKKDERQRLILQQMQEFAPRHLLATRDLARQFAVSETTIRRDFQQLAATGLLQRQHGGVQPNRESQPLAQAQIGVLLVSRIDKYRDPFYNMVLEGVDRQLGRLDCQMAFVKTLHEIDTPAHARHLLRAFDIQGLILLGASESESVAWLRGNFSPIVTVSDRFDIEDELILFDGARGMRLMVAHLAQLGYRRLGYISGYADIRYDGFLQGLRSHSLPCDRSLHQVLKSGPSGWAPDLGERGAAILMSGDKPPEAIVCASDRLAIGAMSWLQRHGYAVPGDVAVTGFDNIPDAEFAFPPLTTVQAQKMRLGMLAAERVVRRVKHPDESHLKIVTPTKLVVRQSCGS